jgi:hypothetical protein
MKKYQVLAVLLLCLALVGGKGGSCMAPPDPDSFFQDLRKADSPSVSQEAVPPPDPTDGWSPYARYGDFLSAQMKSQHKFGYGMFVCKMQAADGPVCSTFWLYSDAPAPGCMPEIAQMWRWNEFDYEFVPYTQATQNSYITLGGDFPKPNVTFYGSRIIDWESPDTQLLKPEAVAWVSNLSMTDNFVFQEMQHYYNRWMVNHNDAATQIPGSQLNYQGAVDTTGPGYAIGGKSNPDKPGWRYASQWKYPLTAVKAPPPLYYNMMRKMTAINWWRMPRGNQSIAVSLPGFDPQTYKFIVKQDGLTGSTAAASYTPAALNNETYVFPNGLDFDPYAGLNTYTIVWTPTRVAFYINAPEDGTDVSNATPVAEYKLADYPSLQDSGPQAPQGKIPWVDTSLSDELGRVSINLANYVAFKAAANKANDQLSDNEKAGAGWSGYPPGPNFQHADAFFRSVKYFPLKADTLDGSNTTDFILVGADVWGFDLADGTWDAHNFPEKISAFFGILYAQDYTKAGGRAREVVSQNGQDVVVYAGDPLRDAKNPAAVTFITNDDGASAPDRKPLMRLRCQPSTETPVRNFFRLGTDMKTGNPIAADNPFMFATLTSTAGTVAVSGASTPLAFFAPANNTSVDATINLYLSKTYHGCFPADKVPAAPDATAAVTLSTDALGQISWSVKTDAHGIITDYQSANPHLITVKPGSATPGS